MLAHRRSHALAIAGLSAAAVALAACGSSSTSDSSPSATATASASPSESGIGGNVLPPVMVADDATTATAKVGDTIVFSVQDPSETKITSSDPTVVVVKDGYTDGSAVFNPSGEAKAAGTAVVTLSNPAVGDRDVTITVQ